MTLQAQRKEAQRLRHAAERAPRRDARPTQIAPVETVSKVVTVTEYFGPQYKMAITLPRIRFLEGQS